MNINKLTRAELISKIQELENQKSKTIEKSVDKKINDNKKINDKKITVDNKSTLIYDIFLKIKTLILSLTFIGILTQVFKNYKTIRVILKFANYIILGIFGMSMFDAFGLGFIVKFLGELKYILGAGVAYLTDTTFYNYLTKIFNVVEEKDSIRDTYKKSEKIDWKAEFEKVERQREIDKWQAKYEKHNEEGIDKKTILLLLLFLGGSIGAWYYGKDALDLIWGGHTLSNLIKKIIRGWRPGDDDEDDDNNNIQLDPDSRAVSPDMLVYASDMVHPKLNEHLPPAPPAPPVASSSNLENPAHTEQGPPNSLLDQIKRGKSLKKAITKESFNEFAGKEVASSKTSLSAKLSNKLDEIRSKVTGDDEEIIEDIGGWDNKSETTPTQSTIIDKGKAKFLDAITRDEEKIMSPSKIANVLADIVQRFPNLSQETLEKLSTVEGLKNRAQILESLSEDELKIDIQPSNPEIDLKTTFDKGKENASDAELAAGKAKITEPFSYYISKEDQIERGIEDKDIRKLHTVKNNSLKEISNMSEKDKEKMEKIIKSSLTSDSESVVKKLSTEFPEFNFSVDSYKQDFMKAVEEEINSGKTKEEKDKIKKEFLEGDLVELQNTGGSSDIKKIRNVIRENYTHNSLLNEILDRAKNFQSLEDLTLSDKEKLESLKLPPDILIEKLKNRSDYAEDSYIESLITNNIDYSIESIIENNPKSNKQEIIEKLIHDNPENKNKILEIVSKSMNKQINDVKEKLNSKTLKKFEDVLMKEDLKELQSLSENRSEDQIRTLSKLNKSHINLLKEIKSKASQTSLRKETSIDSTSSSIDQIDNTMNLFD